MCLVLMGKTCSGKDTVVKRLCNDYGFHKIVTYTTRPMRKREVQDSTYHFISNEEFQKKINDGFFAEYKSYNTSDGKWFYGIAASDILEADDKSVVILTPSGYTDVKKVVQNRVISIYIYANNQTIKARLKKRGDDKSEAERRIAADNEDFKDTMNIADKIVYSNNGTKIEDVVKQVYEYYAKLL